LRDSVGEAIEDLDRLLQLLNTTLDLAEAEAGALHMDRGPVDFSDVVPPHSGLRQQASIRCLVAAHSRLLSASG
jgi:signal transduction histidine kinase